MRIICSKVYQGKNIYSNRKCIRLDLDLEGYGEIPSKEINGFNDHLTQYLPELNKHRCGIDEEGGFVKRLKEGTYIAHICEHIIIALQNMIGVEICYGKARQLDGDYYYVIYEYKYKNSGIEAGNIAVDLINSLICKDSFDIDIRLKELREILYNEQLGLSTITICNEATKRGIPVLRIGEESMVQLGYGKYSKLIQATIGNDTRAISVDIAQDKLLTKEILMMHCLPIANGKCIKENEDLILIAEEIGYPLVLKPQFGNHGEGVITNIGDQAKLVKSFDFLKQKYKNLVLEKFIRGKDYRVCIVYGEIVAVAERVPPYVLGNGENTILELIHEINSDIRRGEGHEKELTKIPIDEELKEFLHQKGYELNSIPTEGSNIPLKDNANLSSGGYAIDCTERICEENIQICKRAADAIGLDICGIDVICGDISKPITDGGAIIEINSAPGIRMHHSPSIGKGRNVAGIIVDRLFKDIPKSIPLIAVTGTNGKTTTTRLISHMLDLSGYKVGMTTNGESYVDGCCIYKGGATGLKSARAILVNKEVEAAVLEIHRTELIREGLAYEEADVAVITNITEEHVGMDEVETIDDLAKVKALVGEAVKVDGYVVVNGDDKMSLSVLNRFKRKRIIFSKNKENLAVRDNINKGGYGIYIDEGYLVLVHNHFYTKLLKVEDTGITAGGILKYNLENAMAASAAAIALGLDYNTIIEGLTTFSNNKEQDPIKGNTYSMKDITVALEYGYNIEYNLSK